MKKYRVPIKSTVYGHVTVPGKSAADAHGRAIRALDEKQISFDDPRAAGTRPYPSDWHDYEVLNVDEEIDAVEEIS